MSNKEPSFEEVHRTIIKSFDLPVYERYDYHSGSHYMTVILQGEPRGGTFSFRQKYETPEGLRYTLEGSGVFKIDGATSGPDRVTVLTPTSGHPGCPWCLTSEPVDASSSVGASKKLVSVLSAAVNCRHSGDIEGAEFSKWNVDNIFPPPPDGIPQR